MATMSNSLPRGAPAYAQLDDPIGPEPCPALRARRIEPRGRSVPPSLCACEERTERESKDQDRDDDDVLLVRRAGGRARHVVGARTGIEHAHDLPHDIRTETHA